MDAFPTRLTSRPAIAFAAALLVAAIGFACDGAPEVAPAPPPAVRQVPPTEVPAATAPMAAEAPAALPSPTPNPTPTPSPRRAAALAPPPEPAYDPNVTMFKLFAGPEQGPEETVRGLQDALLNLDTSQVPVIIELLRFMGIREVWQMALDTLKELAGEEFEGDPIEIERGWKDWLGRNSADYSPPENYLEWKIRLFSMIDPMFAGLLAPAADGAGLNLVEIVWGGVGLDGIRPLENPPNIPAAAAVYLNADDRVFGVSIDGEHRAYPLRILNPHEMANDILGGEPISLAY